MYPPYLALGEEEKSEKGGEVNTGQGLKEPGAAVRQKSWQ